MKKAFLSLLFTIVLSFPALSQGKIHSILKDTVNLNEVVVTGTTVKVNRLSVPMAVSVVNNL